MHRSLTHYSAPLEGAVTPVASLEQAAKAPTEAPDDLVYFFGADGCLIVEGKNRFRLSSDPSAEIIFTAARIRTETKQYFDATYRGTRYVGSFNRENATGCMSLDKGRRRKTRRRKSPMQPSPPKPKWPKFNPNPAHEIIGISDGFVFKEGENHIVAPPEPGEGKKRLEPVLVLDKKKLKSGHVLTIYAYGITSWDGCGFQFAAAMDGICYIGFHDTDAREVTLHKAKKEKAR